MAKLMKDTVMASRKPRARRQAGEDVLAVDVGAKQEHRFKAVLVFEVFHVIHAACNRTSSSSHTHTAFAVLAAVVTLIFRLL